MPAPILYVIFCFKIDFTKNIFHTLNKGVYFLRLEVDWERPDLIKEGNIVIYAS